MSLPISRPGRRPALLLGLLAAVACAGETPSGRGFATPEDAATALVAATEAYDVPALTDILGPEGVGLVVTEDEVQSRNTLAEFAATAAQATRIELGERNTATILIGPGDWPVPIPLVRVGGQWHFDASAGRQEILHRRIGRNELDAIQVCLGYVEAQWEYAAEKRDGALVNQYARRIVSTPGRQDGLAWQEADGTWAGPVGEAIARFIAEGYSDRSEPLHGYYFKILTGQGPDAPLGEIDFMVGGAMIGGFALVAAPAEYEVTGIKTFVVSHDGIVYEKDLGPTTLEQFREMTRYNPDPSWTRVELPPDQP